MKPRGVLEKLMIGQKQQAGVDEENQDEDPQHAADQAGIEAGCCREATIEEVEEPAERLVERLAERPADESAQQCARQAGRDRGRGREAAAHLGHEAGRCNPAHQPGTVDERQQVGAEPDVALPCPQGHERQSRQCLVLTLLRGAARAGPRAPGSGSAS